VALAVSAPVASEPLTAFVPDQAPVPVQEVAFVADHERVEVWPLATVLGAAVRVIAGAAELTDTVLDWVALPPLPVQVSA
jgi:hypothetical protein